ncbi:MAG: metallophosphoesterase family protein [Dysosmobacter sp.]|uniref:metallophosphoesterase family protein n=1 Tax=uncultured Oscillibacter sp. TaxID=876091 RepID=UPI00261D67B5|nr:metallophosphoesterase family protein [uncultured Oscillibacter sp.]MCX4372298.1 metallophosphoesterase family protein [Dysosmobacter sp.]
MKRFIVLSDTHGLLRPEVLDCLSQADIIIHGGDINTQAIADRLREYAPLYIVRGNSDKEWAEDLPQSLTFSVEGVRFFLVHNKKDIPPDLSDTDVVIYGHSHKYACEKRDGVLWLNPGSCGRRRFDQEITFAVMTVDNGRTQAEKVVIPHEKK